MDNYKDKYLKYKKKYLLLKALEQKGGSQYVYNPFSLFGDGLESLRKGLDEILDVTSKIGTSAIVKSKELLKIINVEFSRLHLLIQKLFPRYYYLLNKDELLKFSSLMTTIETYTNLGKKCDYVCSKVYVNPTSLENPCPEEDRIYEKENYNAYVEYIDKKSTHFKEAPLTKYNNGNYISRINKLIQDIDKFTRAFESKLKTIYNKDDNTIKSIISELKDKLSISHINKSENDCKYDNNHKFT